MLLVKELINYRIFEIVLLAATILFAQEGNVKSTPNYRVIRIKKEVIAYKDSVANYQDSVARYNDSLATVKELAKESIPFNLSFGIITSIGMKTTISQKDFTFRKEDSDCLLFRGFAFQIGVSALIPIRENTLAMRIGILYDRSYLFYQEDEAPKDMDTKNSIWTPGNLSQESLSFPIFFSIKQRTDRIMFAPGLQISIPLTEKHNSEDLIKKGLRSSVDISIFFGFAYMMNKNITFDAQWLTQINQTYKRNIIPGTHDARQNRIKLDAIFSPFL